MHRYHDPNLLTCNKNRTSFCSKSAPRMPQNGVSRSQMTSKMKPTAIRETRKLKKFKKARKCHPFFRKRARPGPPRGPQNPSKIETNRLENRFFCNRVANFIFRWFCVKNHTKNQWKSGSNSAGKFSREDGSCKVGMLIFYCKNQYKTHFFINRN